MTDERIIYSNYDLTDSYPDEEVTEYAIESEGYDEEEIDDELLDNLRYRLDEIDYEDLKYELFKFFKNKEVIFFGTLGLWYGTVDGGKTGDFEKVYYEAIKDCSYIKFSDKNGHLYLTCSHHDGTNEFEIKIITEKGKQYLENWEYGPSSDKRTLKDVHTQIVKRYSLRPEFCKKVWGI